jgi:Cu-Zn family superoxide dismutase
MRNPIWLAITASLLAVAVAGPAPAADKNTIGSAIVLGSDGTVKGRLRLASKAGRVELRLDVHGLPPGEHGVHLHALGSCNAPDFASAGPHLNPQAHKHGSLNPQGSHLGDLPNLKVGNGGRGSMTAQLSGSPPELAPLLFDGDGTAVVVHAAADDYRTDPSGNSGERIACGAVTRRR